MRYFCYQIKEDDCAFACLKMILANVYHNKNYLYLKNTKEEGFYSCLEIVEIASKYSLELEGYRFDNKKNICFIKKKPFIAIINQDSSSHAVIVYKIDKKNIEYFDPMFGKRKMKFAMFLAIWQGIALKYNAPEKPFNIKIAKRRLINLKSRFVQLFLKSLSSISFFMFIYFLSPNTYFIFPILSLVAYFLFEIAFNVFSYRLMDDFDKRVIKPCIEKKNSKSMYNNLNILKTLCISNPLILVNNIIVVIAFIALLIINNYYFSLFIIILLCIAFFNVFIFEKKKKASEREIVVMEEEVFKNIQDRKKNYEKLRKKSYIYARFVQFRKLITLFIIAILSVLFIGVVHKASFSDLVFIFFSFSFLNEKFCQILSFSSNLEESNKYYILAINEMPE